MKRKVGALALLSFVFLALIAIVIISVEENLAIQNASNWINHTYNVLQEIEIIRGKFTEASIAIRNYLVLNDQESLNKLPAIQASITIQLKNVEALTADNPVQQKNLSELRILAKDFGNALRKVIFVEKVTDLPSLRKVLSQLSHLDLLNRVNQELAQIKNEELVLLSMGQDKAASAAHYGLFSILIMSIFIVLLVYLFIVLVRSYIEEKRQSEDNLIVLTTNLKASNEQLQEFAMVVSHDLQEPLRKVQAFADRLKHESETVLSDKAKDYLDRMLSACRRMQDLISSLLTLSSVQTAGKKFEDTDLNGIVKDVLTDLENESELSQAKIEVSRLPTVEADPTQMRQLFQNLIGNALKYHKPNQSPIIKISTNSSFGNTKTSQKTSSSLTTKIIIEDNGIGFDKEYAEKIFGVFQRLHTKDEYSGTGVGLAVCKRIVERHYGKIVAESDEGKGTKFIVTLPINQIRGGIGIERS